MPVYEYRCHRCASTYEKLVRGADRADTAACPECGRPGTKVLSVVASVGRASSSPASPAPAGGGGGCCGGGCCSAR